MFLANVNCVELSVVGMYVEGALRAPSDILFHTQVNMTCQVLLLSTHSAVYRGEDVFNKEYLRLTSTCLKDSKLLRGYL